MSESSRTIGQAGFFCAVKHQFSVRTRRGFCRIDSIGGNSDDRGYIFPVCRSIFAFRLLFVKQSVELFIMKPLHFISAELPHSKVVKIMLSGTQNKITAEKIDAGNHSQNCDWLWIVGLQRCFHENLMIRGLQTMIKNGEIRSFYTLRRDYWGNLKLLRQFWCIGTLE